MSPTRAASAPHPQVPVVRRQAGPVALLVAASCLVGGLLAGCASASPHRSTLGAGAAGSDPATSVTPTSGPPPAGAAPTGEALGAAATTTVPVSAAPTVAAPATPSTTVPTHRASTTTTAAPVHTVTHAPKHVAAASTTVSTVAAAPATSTAAAAGGWLQQAVTGWLNSQHVSTSVAVSVAMAGGSGRAWSVDAHQAGATAPVHAGDTYGVLSITKTFTEALVLREVAAGRIDLDAPMPALPGVADAPAGVVITPRMLLQHTSGLVDYSNAVGYDATAPITPQQAVSLSLHSPLLFPPGSRAFYSRVNYHWLGLLLEHTTGQTFGALIDGLAREFGLTHTSLDPTGKPGWTGYASGGVSSTVDDLGRWGAALFTPGRVLSADQVASLTTIGPLGVGMGTWPLCPCSLNPDGTTHAAAVGQVVAHGGIYYYPDQHMVLVVHIDPTSTTAGDETAAIGAAVIAALPHP